MSYTIVTAGEIGDAANVETGSANDESYTFSLIEGHFESEDAREHLFNILSGTQRHYELQSFSNIQRMGKPDDYSESMTNELRQSKIALKQALQEAKKAGKSIKIESQIKVSIV